MTNLTVRKHPWTALLVAAASVAAVAAALVRPGRAGDAPTNPPDKGELLVATQPAGPTTAPSTAPETAPAADRDPIARIRDEGLNRSQVMDTLSYLTDVIGPRLTGSPGARRANEWTRERLTSWGLADSRLEAWGPFGRGWSLRRFSIQVIEPQDIPLIGYPKAWSPGFDTPLVTDVVYVDAKTAADLDKYKGKVRGAAVLLGAVRDVPARFEPLATRASDPDLLRLANADPGAQAVPGMARAMTPADRQALLAGTPLGRVAGGATQPATQPTTQPTTEPAAGPATGPAPSPAAALPPGRVMAFLEAEGAALVLTPSTQGDGGTFYVASVTLPTPPGRDGRTRDLRDAPRPWAAGAPAALPQVTLAVEHFNRLVRMVRHGESLKVECDLRVRFHDADPMSYNTVAEIPGTDLKDEIVMVGAHMDSWHSGTGATDNGAGVAAAMEAVRIIRAAGLRPRRTIRVALWTGEEQGLFGSKAYVAKHFGYFEGSPDDPTPRPTTGPAARPGDPLEVAAVDAAAGATTNPTDPTSRPATRRSARAAPRPAARPGRKLVRLDEYDRLSVYFNLDNGAGRIRGVYMQGNEAVRPQFRRWLTPLADLGATTLTAANTGGTDHQSFDAVGLPAFQFIQDPLEYWTRTHHSNEDVFERAPADDLKQAATVLAAFVYNAAMADERLPRKPVPSGG